MFSLLWIGTTLNLMWPIDLLLGGKLGLLPALLISHGPCANLLYSLPHHTFLSNIYLFPSSPLHSPASVLYPLTSYLSPFLFLSFFFLNMSFKKMVTNTLTFGSLAPSLIRYKDAGRYTIFNINKQVIDL